MGGDACPTPEPLSSGVTMDEALFRWINGWPDAVAPFFVFMSEATKTSVGKVLFAILALAFLVRSNETRKALFLGVAALGLANTITNVLKEGLPDLRPCVELSDITLRVGRLTSFGTASAHSANMASLATMFILVFGWRGAFWVPVALAVGLSRIYVGVHYPSQVLLGWLCGVFASEVVFHVWQALLRLRSRADHQA